MNGLGRIPPCRRGVVVFLVAALWAAGARAQVQEPTPSALLSEQTAPMPAPDEAPVVVLNRTITVFRAPLFGVSAADRARRAGGVLSELLDATAGGAVTVRSEPQGNVILVNGQMGFFLIALDADRLRAQTLEDVTRDAVAQLELVIAETAESRDRTRLVRAAINVAIGTLLLAAFLWIVGFSRRRATEELSRFAERAAKRAQIGGAEIFVADRIRPIVSRVVIGALWVVGAIGVYRWFSYALSQFPYTRPWGEQLRAFFVQTALDLGGGTLRALPDLVVAAIIILVAKVAIRLLQPVFERAARGGGSTDWLDADTARPTERLFTVGIWLFALVMAYPYLPGSSSDAFKGVSVFVGLMISIGGSNLFGQAASGMILMYSRTVRKGEYVRITDQEGTVTEVGAFTLRIRTGLGEEVTLPNSLVMANVVKNYSRVVRGTGYVVDTVVTIGYDTPWRQVEAMLVAAARRTEGVLETPAPRVFQTALSDFYPEYRLVCQATPREPRPRAEVLAALHGNIQDVFNEYGVQIMSPHYLGDPAGPKVVPKDQWYPAPARPKD